MCEKAYYACKFFQVQKEKWPIQDFCTNAKAA